MAHHQHIPGTHRGDTTQVITTEIAVPAAVPAERDRGTLVMLEGPEPGSLLMLDEHDAHVVLGRGDEAKVRIDDRGLSRRHCRIFRMRNRFWIEDLGSTNGTFVNGTLIQQPVPLADSDRISMGTGTIFSFEMHDEKQQAAARRLYDSAVRDPLTKVHNRRYLDDRLEQELAFSQRHHTPLSVLLLDVDHFKSVNDTFGHAAGDAVLQMLAQTMRRLVRTEDLVARYGGEEFCIVARGIPAPGSLVLAERLRSTIASSAVPIDGRSLSVTASVGVSTFERQRTYETVAEMLQAADAALYRAKETGRNRIFHADALGG